MKNFYTIKETHLLTGYSEAHLRRGTSEGWIVSKRILNARLIPAAEVQRLRDQHKIKQKEGKTV